MQHPAPNYTFQSYSLPSKNNCFLQCNTYSQEPHSLHTPSPQARRRCRADTGRTWIPTRMRLCHSKRCSCSRKSCCSNTMLRETGWCTGCTQWRCQRTMCRWGMGVARWCWGSTMQPSTAAEQSNPQDSNSQWYKGRSTKWSCTFLLHRQRDTAGIARDWM